MRPNWRLSSLRVFARQLRSARATLRQQLHNVTAPWRIRFFKLRRWLSANRRPLISLSLLILFFAALLVYDRPTWPPLLPTVPETGSRPLVPAPAWPDAVWPRPGGPAYFEGDEQSQPSGPGEAEDGEPVTQTTAPPMAANEAAVATSVLTASGEELHVPVDGDVISAFGFRLSPAHGDFRFHTGVDVAAPPGTPVQAAYSGIVTESGFDPQWGWHVRMDLGDGRIALYGNLDRIDVESGAAVRQGTVIGTVGNSAPAELATANAAVAHLHFELQQAGEAIPPGFGP